MTINSMTIFFYTLKKVPKASALLEYTVKCIQEHRSPHRVCFHIPTKIEKASGVLELTI